MWNNLCLASNKLFYVLFIIKYILTGIFPESRVEWMNFVRTFRRKIWPRNLLLLKKKPPGIKKTPQPGSLSSFFFNLWERRQKGNWTAIRRVIFHPIFERSNYQDRAEIIRLVVLTNCKEGRSLANDDRILK